MSKVSYQSILASSGLFACLLLQGCTGGDPSTTKELSAFDKTSVSLIEGQTPSKEAQSIMIEAKEALFKKLSQRLMEAIGNHGPASAIEVCRREATEIAQKVGESHSVEIGRVGVRLRNPSNQPPSWAKPLTDKMIETPRFVSLTNGKSGALLPIKLQPQCLMCHGPSEQIPLAIKEQLAKSYPNDEATNFQMGELRGWFWLEITQK